jgi:hypothetical protein
VISPIVEAARRLSESARRALEKVESQPSLYERVFQSHYSPSSEPIKPIIDANLSPNAREVVTDGGAVYGFIIPPEKHTAGNHKEEIASRKGISNQSIEGAFGLFKRGVIGSYHRLGTEHLDRYLGEFCWRYNRRGIQPMLFNIMLGNLAANKPMPYKELTKF